MNKEYTYLNGKCIIEDENGNKRLEDYTDNIDDILIQENVIETLENDLKTTMNNIKTRNQKEKNVKLNYYFSIFVFLLPLIGSQLAFRLLLGPNASAIMMEMHPLMTPFVKGIFIFMSVSFGGIGFLSNYVGSRENRRSLEGLESEKEALENTIIEEKNDLEELNKEKEKKEVSQEFFEKEVDDLEELRNIRKYIALYYDCGANRKKYQEYYEKGILDKKLRKYYTEYGIKLIKEWLDEKNMADKLEEQNEEEITRKLK